MTDKNTICAQCNTKFYKKPYLKKGNKTGLDFCSTACYGKWKTIPKIKKCENCEEDFTYKRKEQRFCSLVCAAKRTRKQRYNGNTKNKSQRIKNKFLNKGWDGKCMVKDCSYSKALDSHRLLSGSQDGTYEETNVAIICPNHHAEIHRLHFTPKNIGLFIYILENIEE